MSKIEREAHFVSSVLKEDFVCRMADSSRGSSRLFVRCCMIGIHTKSSSQTLKPTLSRVFNFRIVWIEEETSLLKNIFGV
jgi:hypothetical protein